MVIIPLAFRYVTFALPGSAAESVGLQRFLYTYVSPTVTVASISLFVFFPSANKLRQAYSRSKHSNIWSISASWPFCGQKIHYRRNMFKISSFSGVFDDTDDVDVCTDGFLICTGMELMRRYLFRFTKMNLLMNKTVNSIRKILRTERRRNLKQTRWNCRTKATFGGRFFENIWWLERFISGFMRWISGKQLQLRLP